MLEAAKSGHYLFSIYELSANEESFRSFREPSILTRMLNEFKELIRNLKCSELHLPTLERNKAFICL